MSFFTRAAAVAAVALLALPVAAHADPFTDSGTWTDYISGGSAPIFGTPDAPGSVDAADGTAGYYNTASPASADYTVDADFYTGFFYDWHGQESASYLACRFNPSTGEGYFFGYESDLHEWITPVGTVPQDFVWDTSEHVQVICDGSTLTLKVDGVTIASGTDTNISSAGKAAWQMENGGVDATDVSERGIGLSGIEGNDL